MKKILLGTTAIVAVGMIAAPASAAEKIKLGIGGYMEQYIGFVDAEDDASRTDWAVFDQQSDSEFHLTGSTTLDNGIKFGVKFEIEGDVAGIDESVMTISSATLGEVKLGEKVVEIAPPDPIGELGSGFDKIAAGEVDKLTDLTVGGQ